MDNRRTQSERTGKKEDTSFSPMVTIITPELQHNVKEKLKKLLYVPFKFENLGSQIIYYAPEDNF